MVNKRVDRRAVKEGNLWDKYGTTLFYVLLTVAGSLAMLTINFQVKSSDQNREALKTFMSEERHTNEQVRDNIAESTKVQTILIQKVEDMSEDVKENKKTIKSIQKDVYDLNGKIN